MTLNAGDRIDRYTLLAPIGEGGQGTVWRVMDPLDGGVERALKLVPTESLPPGAAERARREARTLAAAPHPNVVACYGLFEDVSTGMVGLVLELVDGKPLHEVLEDPRMSGVHKRALLLQLAEALAHVHSMEIVHRDLKADNVVVSERFWTSPREAGTIKLVDFGIATRVHNPHPLTLQGDIVGTAPYLAPEAVLPGVAPTVAAGYARDIFAFGVLAYELFTGKHPTGLSFAAGPADFLVAYARVKSEASGSWPPEGLPDGWKQPVASCLALDSARRPASGVELLELLLEEALKPAGESLGPPVQASPLRASSDPILETVAEPVLAGPPAKAASHPKPRVASAAGSRKGSKLGAGLLLAVLLGLGAAGIFIRAREAPPRSETSATVAPVHSARPSPGPAPSATGCPVTCCGGYACTARPENARGCAPEGGHCRACPSDRACVPGPCDGRIADSGVWLLRLAGVTAGGKDVIPRPRVCLRHGGADAEPWVCHPGGTEKRGPRLRVTTAELTHEGIDLGVTRPDDTMAVGAHVHHPAIGVAALCRGLNFRFTSAEGVAYAVTLFLDDPED
jgi:serine/threonine-protein kinase